MNDFFISYKVHNRRTAIEYYKNLKQLNHEVWFDQLVPKLADWKDTIKQQIKNSKIFICLLSQACLLDDWVLSQIKIARKAHKKIYFITLDETDWSQYKEYKVPLKTYSSLEELYLILIDEKANMDLTSSYQGMNNFTLNFIFIAICAVLVSCFGVHLFNLKLGMEFGSIVWGILTCVVLTYISKRIVFILQGILAVILLYLTIYVFPTYVISSIAVNTIFFLWFYLFGTMLRFSKKSIVLAFFISFLSASFCVLIYSSILIFPAYFLDYDCSWLSFIILILYIVYLFFTNRKDLK